MIKQNGFLEKTCKFSKTHSVQNSIYSNTWTEWIGLSEFSGGKKKKKKTLVFKVAILCMWSEGRVVVMIVCVGGESILQVPDTAPLFLKHCGIGHLEN